MIYSKNRYGDLKTDMDSALQIEVGRVLQSRGAAALKALCTT